MARVDDILAAEQPAFARAVKAVIAGDTAALRAALAAEPALVRARSRAVHRATLLHYTAANGIEDALQHEVRNAHEIAGVLLGAGAEPDAPCDAYDGGYPTTLSLLVSSDHPNAAGIAGRLIAILCAHGAAVDGVDGDGFPLATALCFANIDSVDALLAAGARSENVVFAAAAGTTDWIRAWLDGDGHGGGHRSRHPFRCRRTAGSRPNRPSSSPACADGSTWSASSSAAASTSMPARRGVSAPAQRCTPPRCRDRSRLWRFCSRMAPIRASGTRATRARRSTGRGTRRADERRRPKQ